MKKVTVTPKSSSKSPKPGLVVKTNVRAGCCSGKHISAVGP